VTGATGWFGRVTLDLLAAALGPEAFAARVTGYASTARTVPVAGAGEVALRPFAELAPADVLLHFAFLTPDRLAAVGHERFVAANLALTRRVQDVLEGGRVGALVLASSGAARAPDLDANPYGALKRLDELVLRGPATVVARVFAVGGPHLARPEIYALGDLVARALAGRPLVVRATRPVVRAYAAIGDVVALALAEALAGRDAAFDTGGEEVEVGELADVVRHALARPDLEVERPPLEPGAAADRYVGDPAAMRELARRHGVELQPLEAIVRATAAGLAG
jgi:dTDP-glucose 4,6-dehydratase